MNRICNLQVTCYVLITDSRFIQPFPTYNKLRPILNSVSDVRYSLNFCEGNVLLRNSQWPIWSCMSLRRPYLLPFIVYFTVYLLLFLLFTTILILNTNQMYPTTNILNTYLLIISNVVIPTCRADFAKYYSTCKCYTWGDTAINKIKVRSTIVNVQKNSIN